MKEKNRDRSLKTRKHHVSYLFIPLSSLLFFSIGFMPFVGFVYVIMRFLPLDGILFYLLLPFFICIGLYFLIVSQMFLSSLLIRLFHLYYEAGSYDYDTNEKNALKWMIFATVYTPLRKILEIVPMGEFKIKYLRLMGMKIGNNSLIGGVIKDPCVTSFGSHSTMGEYAIIYGHIHNYEKKTISIDPVSVGNNCVIGAGAIVMPGAIIEDNVNVAAGALVTKKQRLISGNTYVGIPAKKK